MSAQGGGDTPTTDPLRALELSIKESMITMNAAKHGQLTPVEMRKNETLQTMLNIVRAAIAQTEQNAAPGPEPIAAERFLKPDGTTEMRPVRSQATQNWLNPPAQPESAGSALDEAMEWLQQITGIPPGTPWMPKSYTESILAHISQLESANAELRGTEERLTRKQHMSDLNYDAMEKARDSYENEVCAERDSLQQQIKNLTSQEFHNIDDIARINELEKQLAEARAKLGTWTSTCTGHHGSQMSCGYYVDAAIPAEKGATPCPTPTTATWKRASTEQRTIARDNKDWFDALKKDFDEQAEQIKWRPYRQWGNT